MQESILPPREAAAGRTVEYGILPVAMLGVLPGSPLPSDGGQDGGLAGLTHQLGLHDQRVDGTDPLARQQGLAGGLRDFDVTVGGIARPLVRVGVESQPAEFRSRIGQPMGSGGDSVRGSLSGDNARQKLPIFTRSECSRCQGDRHNRGQTHFQGDPRTWQQCLRTGNASRSETGTARVDREHEPAAGVSRGGRPQVAPPRGREAVTRCP